VGGYAKEMPWPEGTKRIRMQQFKQLDGLDLEIGNIAYLYSLFYTKNVWAFRSTF
jgi:hypothetical protein